MFRWLTRRPSARPRASAPFRPRLESLEERAVPAISEPFPVANSSVYETAPATAGGASSGARVVVWQESNSGQADIHAQRLDYRGEAVGPEIIVSGSPDAEFDPDVAMDRDGRFVVVWTQNFGDSSDLDVRFALFNSAGTLITGGFVAGSLSLNEHDAHVGMSAQGSFVVSYTVSAPSLGADIHARRFDAAGHPLGGAIQVAARPDVAEHSSHVDRNPAGAFAISYTRNVSATADGVFLKRYSRNGQLLGSVRIAGVDNSISGFPRHDVGMDRSGNVTVVYENRAGDLVMRRAWAAGGVSAVRTLVHDSVTNFAPRVAVDPRDGDFVLTYQQYDGTDRDTYVREFGKSGALRGVHPVSTDDSESSAVSIDRFGTYLVVFAYSAGTPFSDILAALGGLE